MAPSLFVMYYFPSIFVPSSCHFCYSPDSLLSLAFFLLNCAICKESAWAW
jgi:hypothetical protein